jgi:two-component system, sensor histidine kinase PdtaS
VLPGIKESNPVLLQAFMRVALTGEADRLEAFIPQMDKWVSIAVYCPQTGYLVVTFDDITKRKQTEKALVESEKQLYQIVQFLPEAILVINLKGEVVAWNKPMEIMTGIAAQDMIGKGNYAYALPFYGIRRPILADMVLLTVEAADGVYYDIKREGDVLTAETYVPNLQGKSVYLWGIACLLRNSRGEVIGAIETIRDITAIQMARNKLNASLEEKDILLKEIQHRVKNNMQVVSSLLSLQSGFIKDKDDLSMFQESQNRISSMALVYKKLYQSKDLANIDIKEYAGELVDNLMDAYSLDAERIQTIVDIDNILLNLDLAIPCGLLINELISNALKYAFPAERQGKITIALHRAQGDRIEMTVADDGIGFPDNFDYKEGRTLGMELVHMLAEQQLGGTIETRHSGGTEFRITFPIAAA